MISIDKNQPDDKNFFPEREIPFMNMTFHNSDPNYEYLIRNVSDPFYTVAYRKFRSYFQGKVIRYMILHDDGWLEVNPASNDEDMIAQSKKYTITKYRKIFSDSKLSEERLESLFQIMRYLQGYGKVVLVRLPVGLMMQKIEEEYMPDFDSRIKSVCQKENCHYLNLYGRSGDFKTNDENHLHKTEARKVTQIIIEKLKILPERVMESR